MRAKAGLLFIILSSMIAPAVAQDAKTLLAAADKAMGASAVNSVTWDKCLGVGYGHLAYS